MYYSQLCVITFANRSKLNTPADGPRLEQAVRQTSSVIIIIALPCKCTKPCDTHELTQTQQQAAPKSDIRILEGIAVPQLMT